MDGTKTNDAPKTQLESKQLSKRTNRLHQDKHLIQRKSERKRIPIESWGDARNRQIEKKHKGETVSAAQQRNKKKE